MFTRGKQMLSPGAPWNLIAAEQYSALVNMADAKFDEFPLDLVILEFFRSRMPGLRSSQERCVVWSLFGSMVPANAAFALDGAALLPGKNNDHRDLDFVLYGPLTKVPSSPGEYVEQRHLNILSFYFYQLVGKHLTDGLDPFEGALLLWTLAQASLDYPAFDQQLVLRAHTADARRRQPRMIMLVNKDAKGKKNDDDTVRRLLLQQCKDGLRLVKVNHLTDPEGGSEWGLFACQAAKFSTRDDDAECGIPKARSIEDTWPGGILIDKIGVGFALNETVDKEANLVQMPIIEDKPVYLGLKLLYQINGDELAGKANDYRGLGVTNAAFEHICVSNKDGEPGAYTFELSLKLLPGATFVQGQVLVDYGPSFGYLPTLKLDNESIFSDSRTKDPRLSTYWDEPYAKSMKGIPGMNFDSEEKISLIIIDSDDDDTDADAEEQGQDKVEAVLEVADEDSAAAQAPKRKGVRKGKKTKAEALTDDDDLDDHDSDEDYAYEDVPPKKKAKGPLTDPEVLSTKKAARSVGRSRSARDKKEGASEKAKRAFYDKVKERLGISKASSQMKNICKKIFLQYCNLQEGEDSDISGLEGEDSSEDSSVHTLHIFYIYIYIYIYYFFLS